LRDASDLKVKVKVLRSCTWRLTFGESVAERKGGDADWAEGVCFSPATKIRARSERETGDLLLATCCLVRVIPRHTTQAVVSCARQVSPSWIAALANRCSTDPALLELELSGWFDGRLAS